MKIFPKAALFAGIALAATAAVAAPVAAQVTGSIAAADPTQVVARSVAVRNAYQAIRTAYGAQATQLQTQQNELGALQRQLDTNNDGQLDEAEQNAARTTKANVVTQMQAKENQINTTLLPIVTAQRYAIEQVIKAYPAAQAQVVAAKKIAVILTPESIIYAPNQVDVTSDIVTAIDRLTPNVSTTVPAGWQPQRETVTLHQQVGQLFALSAAIQQQGQAQQPAKPATQPQTR